MRELTRTEVDQVSGGVINIGSAALGAGIGGLVYGASYAASARNFSWGNFTMAVASGTASGFLIGSGAALLVSGIPGYATLGATSIGLGGAVGVAGSVAVSGGGASGGGSD